MGQAARHRPIKLSQKLVEIRTKLKVSQNELINRLGLANEITQARISAYERGVREPPLIVLLHYARVAGVYVDALIDDALELPEKLPAAPKSEGIGIKSSTKSTAKRVNRTRRESATKLKGRKT